MSRHVIEDEEICELVDDVRGVEGSRHPDGQRLAAELAMDEIGDEIIRPDVVGTLQGRMNRH